MTRQTKKIVCIIPARGGSKGIPKKNIINFLGKPLIQFSIENAKNSKYDIDIYVSSDCDEILGITQECGAKSIKRPSDLSSDVATSESALLHAIDTIERHSDFDVCVFLQATSPLRHARDIDDAIDKLIVENLDAVFSGALLEDFLIWQKNSKDNLESVNYDYTNRQRRQDRKHQFVENGSIYVFRKDSFKKTKNRIHGKFDVSLMEPWKNFEIDSLNDLEICELIYDKKMR